MAAQKETGREEGSEYSVAEVITTHYTCEAAMASRLARVRAWQSAVQSKDDVR